LRDVFHPHRAYVEDQSAVLGALVVVEKYPGGAPVWTGLLLAINDSATVRFTLLDVASEVACLL